MLRGLKSVLQRGCEVSTLGVLHTQGYTNYQLDPSKGTYTKLDANSAPPFMGVDPNGRPYTSPAQAPGPGGASAPRMAASQAAAAQQVRWARPAALAAA